MKPTVLAKHYCMVTIRAAKSPNFSTNLPLSRLPPEIYRFFRLQHMDTRERAKVGVLDSVPAPNVLHHAHTFARDVYTHIDHDMKRQFHTPPSSFRLNQSQLILLLVVQAVQTV